MVVENRHFLNTVEIASTASAERTQLKLECTGCGVRYDIGSAHQCYALPSSARTQEPDEAAYLRWWHEQESLGANWMERKAFNGPARAAWAAWQAASALSAIRSTEEKP
jgi:hypothetical protein